MEQCCVSEATKIKWLCKRNLINGSYQLDMG